MMDKRCPVHGTWMLFEGSKNIPGHLTEYAYRCVGHWFGDTDGVYRVAVHDSEIVEFTSTDELAKWLEPGR